MASWHKRARLGVAIFGVAIATIVYFAMGERQAASAPSPITRLDPKAVLEITQGIVEGITGIEKNFELQSKSSTTYSDGSTRHNDATIIVHKGENRTFKVIAREARVGKDQNLIELAGDVKLEDSDGFFLTTDAATYDRKASLARTPAAVTFGKGRMSGSGVGITYDQANNVLVISEQAQVTTRDEAGQPVMEFTGGSATLDRTQHRLTVENAVHVMRDEEVIESDRANASLSDNDDVIRFLELRGNSRVEGGGAGIDAMSARDINLDYTDDGQRLEAVVLDGTAAVARKSGNGTQQIVSELIDLQLAADGSSRMVLTKKAAVTMTGEQGGGGRKIAAEVLQLDIAADGTLIRANGRDGVRLDLPSVEGAPARSIQANTLEGSGQAGQGLTRTVFTGNVVFTEEERRAGAAAAGTSATRTARAQALDASLANDAVTGATFTTDVSFEEAGFKACAARLTYQPEKGTLALSGDTPAGKPIVAEEQKAIEAATIDVTLDSRRMSGKGGVTTVIGAPARCRPAAARPAAQQSPNRLPGLLQPDSVVTIKASALEYDGAAGTALYSGRASVSQANTSIHGDTIAIDQEKGDLTASGNAIATLQLDGETSTGRAHEIGYVDAKRLLRYSAPPPPPPGTPVPPAPVPAGRGAVQSRDAQVTGRQEDLRATNRIDVLLAKEGGQVTRIEAYGGVRLKQGQKTANGAERLVYDAAAGTYVLTAGPAAPVVLVADCRENRGKMLTFSKSNDTIEIDGKDERRTTTGSAGGPCTPPPATR